MSLRLPDEEINKIIEVYAPPNKDWLFNYSIKLLGTQISYLANMTPEGLVEEIAKINQGNATNFKIKWEDESQEVRDYELNIARQISAFMTAREFQLSEKHLKNLSDERELYEAQIKELQAQIKKVKEEEAERIYNMSTGQETRSDDKGNIWIRFDKNDWQSLKGVYQCQRMN